MFRLQMVMANHLYQYQAVGIIMDNMRLQLDVGMFLLLKEDLRVFLKH